MTDKQIKRYCEELIRRIMGKQQSSGYKIEIKQQEKGYEATYYCLYQGIPVEESKMVFTIGGQGVTQAEFELVKIETTDEVTKTIYPIDLVLFGLQDYIINQGSSVITNVELVYKKAINDNNLWGQNIVPAYKISFKGLEEAVFVNAYSNQIIK